MDRESKYRTGKSLIIAGAVCVVIGGGLIAYGAGNSDSFFNGDTFSTVAITGGAVLVLVGLLAFLWPGIYLRLKYRDY